MRPPPLFDRIFVHTLNLVSPPQCPACRRASNQSGLSLLCPHCRPVFRNDYFCLTCGHYLPELPWLKNRRVHHCRACTGKHIQYHQARNLGIYRDRWKKVIIALKCQPNQELIHQLTRWSIKRLRQNHFLKPWDGITVVPERHATPSGIGFVASRFARQLGIPFSRLIMFIKKGAPQHTLDRKNRLKNMAGSMQVKTDMELSGHWLLIDDVYTTGATVQEAARVMKNNGIKTIDVFTLARGLDRRMSV